MMRGDALIRGNFGIDPATLDHHRWAMLFNEAVWLESQRLKNIADLLAAMYGNNGK